MFLTAYLVLARTHVLFPGANRWGQLGRGDRNVTGDEPDEMGDNLIPVDLGTGESASSMALGTDHSCVILESGDVKVRVRLKDARICLLTYHFVIYLLNEASNLPHVVHKVSEAVMVHLSMHPLPARPNASV